MKKLRLKAFLILPSDRFHFPPTTASSKGIPVWDIFSPLPRRFKNNLRPTGFEDKWRPA